VRTAGWALALVAAAIVTRLPFQTQWPYAWDSILYIRALQRFDVVQHQPQPPGYIFYVALAWLLDQIMGDPNRALVTVSILGTAWAAVALYALGVHLGGPRVGIVASLFLLSSPTFWAYGEVAYPYTVLAATASTLALLVVWTLTGPEYSRRRRLLIATFIYALMGGLRQDILLLLMPLYLLTLWRRPATEWALAIAVGMAGTLTWLVPSAYFSGSIANYLGAVFQQTQKVGEASSLATTGASIVEENLRPLLLGLWHGLYFVTLAFIYLAIRRAFLVRWGLELTIAALWIAPPMIFYTGVHIGDVGYTFSILPAFCLLASLGTEQLVDDLSHSMGATAMLSASLAVLLVGSNAGQFLLRPGTSPYSARGLQCRDQQIAAKINFVRNHFPAGPTVLLGVDTYQHTSYLLPNYWSYDKLAAHRQLRENLPAGMEWAVVLDDSLVVKGSWHRASMPCSSSVRYRHLAKPAKLLYHSPVLALVNAEPARWKPN
jgi:hypothetical protein